MIRFLATIAIICLAGFGLVNWFELSLQAKINHGYAERYIAIAPGSTPNQIVEDLASKGIVNQPQVLLAYIKLTDQGPLIKAGDYKFPTPISSVEVLEQLKSGGLSANKLTVIEGWNRFDIAQAMMAMRSLHISDVRQALKLMDNKKLIADLDPAATNLEGYLFPETYLVYLKDKPKDLIDQMVKQFKNVWQEKLASKAEGSGLSIHDIVTIGSIIETEAKLKEERKVIASVIFNRIRKDMPLGMDSTVVYASQLASKWRNDGRVYQSDLDIDSPYNTRKYKGLPPGPVCSPGYASLAAALTPAETNYLYYVRDPNRNDGKHNFYTDEAGFEKGVKALRQWELKQGRK